MKLRIKKYSNEKFSKHIQSKKINKNFIKWN